MITVRMVLRQWCKNIHKVEKNGVYFTLYMSSKIAGVTVENKLKGRFGSALVGDGRMNQFYMLDVHEGVIELLLGKIIMGVKI